MPRLKACKKCGRIKSFLSFYTSKLTSDGHENKCKKCRKIRMRKIYKSDESHRRRYLYQKEWVKNNPERNKIIAARTRAKARWDVLVAYSGNPPKCACCNEEEYVFLQLDHINGGGTNERIKYGAGVGLFCWLRKKKFPKGYQILCANCNYAKIRGECPHKIKNGKN